MVAGASCGLMGVYVVGLRLPFVGICISHAATAGIVFSLLVGCHATWPAVIFAGLVSTSLALVRPERSRIEANTALAVLFSLMLGLTFLGIGMIKTSRSEVLGMLWGNILFVTPARLWSIVIAGSLFAVCAVCFNKELKVILFSRSLALATGLHEPFVYAVFLAVMGMTLTVNLPLIGGLMIFSLITNPAAAAYQVCHGHRAVVCVSTGLGLTSGALGVLVSWWTNLPTGACIVTVSAVFFGLAVLIRTVRA